MKKRILPILFALMGVALIIAPAQAAYIDLRPDGVSMVSDGQAYDPGDGDLTLEVWIMPETGEAVLENYSFDIMYDVSETITYTDGTASPPSGWFSFNPITDAPPYVQNIEGATFGEGVSLTGGVLVATLDFSFDYTALNNDSAADFSLYLRPGQGLTVDGIVQDATLIGIGPDLNAVPIPGAALLLGSGLIGLVGMRRRK
jgi:hypothetical protein